MVWETCYTPPSSSLWQGRTDIPDTSCFFQVMKMLDMHQPILKASELSFALIGFCCDEGIARNQGRTGAKEGPDAIRQTLAKLSIQRQYVSCFDAGNIVCSDGNLEKAQQALGEVVAMLLHQDYIPIVLGGGHELAWGHYQGIAKNYPTEKLGIINFDAHFDMRPLLAEAKGSSGTPFLQIAEAHQQHQRQFNYNCVGIQRASNIPSLFATAEKYHASMLLADDIQENHSTWLEFITDIIQANQILYLSLCLDVFASAYAPGVSAPQSLGLTPWQIIPMVRKLAECGKVISYDIAELSPQYDKDQRTAKLAANFIYEIIHHHNAH